MLSKEQSNQFRKLKKLYWRHCLNDGSQMTRIDEHYLFRSGKSARCVYVDAETDAEIDKVKYLLFSCSLM
jgi:hypothetical protein